MSNMVVRTNVYALNAHRNMKNVGLQQKQASNRLSSGYRINSAADDAAGLAISENMRAQIRGLDQASRNAQDGQAMLLTTEGGLEEIGNMLQRVRELMVQAPNDTNTQNQRELIKQEIAQLGKEILSMQNRVEFNTNRVLSMAPGMTTSVISAASQMFGGAQNMEMMGAMLKEQQTRLLAAINLFSELAAGSSVASKGAAFDALQWVNTALVTSHYGVPITAGNPTVAFTAPTALSVAGVAGLSTIASSTAATGATGVAATTSTASITLSAGQILGKLQSALNDVNTAITSLSSVDGGKMRTAFRTAQGDVRTYVNTASTANNIAFFQVGANASQGISFDFEAVGRAVGAAGYTVSLLSSVMAAPGAGNGIGNGVRISPFISALDDSINDISKIRANLGAVQNRMDYTMRSLDISSENLQDSESRVRNADVAKEMMKFTMTNVLQQAAISMLSQANQLPNNLMQLLR
ncbi:MAG: hypothetical protein FWG87_06520 [Defluviitaleaceae bacterium]|nr:hypothetical protein [Defluviitaleaceae bacterium]